MAWPIAHNHSHGPLEVAIGGALAGVPSLGDGFFTRLWFGPRRDEIGLGGVRHIAHAGSAEDLFMFIFWVCVVSFVLVVGLTVYFTIKYRRRPGVPTERSPAHNTPLEITWSVVPTIVLVIIFFWGYWGFAYSQVPGADPEVIEIEGQKWFWKATYANGAVSGEVTLPRGALEEAPVFLVPADRPVLLKLKSTDVIHSFFVPDFRKKSDVFPNRYTSFAFRAMPLDEANGYQTNNPSDWAQLGKTKGKFFTEAYKYRDHVVFCAEFCGDSHSRMSALIRVVEPAVYRDIVSSWTGPSEGASPLEVGQWAFRAKGCAACHSVDGKSGTGPTWQNLFGYENSYGSAGRIVVDDNHLRESILVPAAKIRDGFANQMSIQPLTEREVSGLIAYIRSLSDRAPASLLEPGGG